MPKRQSFDLRKLCTPASIYFTLSIMGLILIGIQNMHGEEKLLCIGSYDCQVNNKSYIFVANLVYIIFWTFILDLMCKTGYKDLSWLVLLLPILTSFIYVGLLVYHTGRL
jgi:hypothetical protein